jgi:uncharacterized protein YlxW (UPF0749 family)
MIKKTFILSIGIIVGFLGILQWRSYENIQSMTVRGSQSDIEHEIAILITTNQSLREELSNLKTQKVELNTDYLAYERVQENLNQAEVLAGGVAVEGEGVSLTIQTAPTLAELTDLLNEISQLGAEAIAINGTRLTNQTVGLSAYNEALVLDGQVLTLPLRIDAIGNAFILKEGIDKTDSVLHSLRQRSAEGDIEILTAEKIVLQPVSS